jgi:hypothetical protein
MLFFLILLKVVVRVEGLEPPRFRKQHLNLVRLLALSSQLHDDRKNI